MYMSNEYWLVTTSCKGICNFEASGTTQPRTRFKGNSFIDGFPAKVKSIGITAAAPPAEQYQNNKYSAYSGWLDINDNNSNNPN